MYDRYGDISKFITDAEQLCVVKDIDDEIPSNGLTGTSASKPVDMCVFQAMRVSCGSTIHKARRIFRAAKGRAKKRKNVHLF